MGVKASPSIAVVTQETRLKGLVGRWATKSAAAFRLKRAHLHEFAAAAAAGPGKRTRAAHDEQVAMELADFSEYEREDLTYQQTLELLHRDLDVGLPLKFVPREYLPNFDFDACVAVVVVGRDGLVANAAKYVGEVPVVGVNPDPQRIDGILVPFAARQARGAVQRVLNRRAKIRAVTLAEVNLNDGQRMLAFNDFFAGCRSHVSAHYTLRVAGRAEVQSSSGLLLSTGAGSTGWLSSLLNMAQGFATWLGGRLDARCPIRWEDRRLVWAVREPFRSKSSGAELVAGFVDEGQQLLVESLMPSGGVIFSDGVESDALEFNSGAIARFGVAQQRTQLVVA